MSDRATPVGGPILTKPFMALACLTAIAMVLIGWRFAAGIGPVSALSDGYPWGLWIAFDVVTGTALACGGYAMALLIYVLNKGKYHPMIRPALLTSALGYSIAGLSLAVDVGRPWNFWRVPVYVTHWNFNSALFEVALCIMSYTVVCWIEMAPVFLESAAGAPHPILRKVAAAVSPVLERSLVWIIALGMLLPTMHQSSLGTLMVLTGRKVHPLWQTPLLPLLFLLSCMVMGYAAVVFESTLSSWLFGRRRETKMLASLSGAMSIVIGLFLAVRLADLFWRGQLPAMVTSGGYTVLLAAELALLLLPLFTLVSPFGRTDPGRLFRTAMWMMLAGSLYRFDSFLVAFNPGPGWSYFPAVPEMVITFGLVALEIMAYVVIVKRFPILSGAAHRDPLQVRSHA